MIERANYVLIAMTVLLSCGAIWLNCGAVAMVALAYGIHRGRPHILGWFR